MAANDVISQLHVRNAQRATDVRKNSLFSMVDSDSSGTIDQSEFNKLYDVIKSQAEADLKEEAQLTEAKNQAVKRSKLYKALFVGAVILVLIQTILNFAMVFAVVDSAVKTTTGANGALEMKGSDTIVKTAVASQALPLVVAPYLTFEELDAVKSIRVTVIENQAPVTEKYMVTGFRWHSTSSMAFRTVSGDQIRISDSKAYLDKIGATYPVCSANATCSSFKAFGIDAASRLAEAGVILDEQRRRLYDDCYRDMGSAMTPHPTPEDCRYAQGEVHCITDTTASTGARCHVKCIKKRAWAGASITSVDGVCTTPVSTGGSFGDVSCDKSCTTADNPGGSGC